MNRTSYRALLSFTLIGATLLTNEGVAQQKGQFSQYMFNTMLINPAYAGADGALSVTFLNRSQWAGVENAPVTQAFSAHTLIRKKQLGLGVTVLNDNIGIHRNLSALGNYAYHVQITRKAVVSLGLQAGIHSMHSNYLSLSASPATDPKLLNAVASRTFFDLGAGIYFRNEKLHIGLSMPELLPERLSFLDTVNIRLRSTNYFLFTRYRFTHSENVDYEPSALLKYLPGLPVSYDLNINMIYRKVLTLGLSYRKRESVDFLLKMQITSQVELGYGYDHAIGPVSRISNGSHEVMAHYVFKYSKTKVSSPR